MASSKELHEEEIDLGEVIKALWAKKFVIAGFTLVAAIISVVYALSIDNVYESKTVLAPKSGSGSDNLGRLASQFGGLASMAGLSIPLGGDQVTKSKLAQEKMRSLDFFARYIYPKILPELAATTSWDAARREMLYDETMFNPKTREWTAKGLGKPSIQKAFKLFQGSFVVSEDPISTLVTLRARHESPIIANRWLELIISSITEDLRTDDITEAEDSIRFIQEQRELTKLVAIDEVFSQLIEEQLKVVMLAKVSKNYVFQIIEPPYVPEDKVSPRRSIICIFGTMIGVVCGVTLVLIRRFAMSQ